jgi:hypothetical protein
MHMQNQIQIQMQMQMQIQMHILIRVQIQFQLHTQMAQVFGSGTCWLQVVLISRLTGRPCVLRALPMAASSGAASSSGAVQPTEQVNASRLDMTEVFREPFAWSASGGLT